MQTKIARLGNWLGQHQKLIRRIQWIIIGFYALLIIVPVNLPLPDDTATLFHNLTVFAQFLFWGIWWPFVLLSIVLFGRMWCGVFCPEGALSEFANRYGQERKIPRWIRWRGWAFVAFALTTLYGQLTSVYQYPKPVLLILGGSTVGAIIVGFLYGKSSRVWCKYLCPVTGVFSLLSRLAPIHFKPNQEQWNDYQGPKTIAHCPVLLPLKTMKGSANCLMCGKCSNFRNAIELTVRSPNEEVVKHGMKNTSLWESALIIFGLCGIALGAFQWSESFWFNHLRDIVESWLLVHNLSWAFATNAPWWIFTNYPDQMDQFSWIYGLEVIVYILSIALFTGTVISLLLFSAACILGKPNRIQFNHLSQALIPLGGCTVFIGLLANTFTDLQKYANLGFTWTNEFKAVLLALATFWSMILAFKIIKQYSPSFWRRALSFLCMLAVFLLVDYFWVLMLHVWTIKADQLPWSTLWVSY